MRVLCCAVALLTAGNVGISYAQQLDVRSVTMTHKEKTKLDPSKGKSHLVFTVPAATDAQFTDSIAAVSTDEAEASVGRGYDSFRDYITDYKCVQPKSGKYKNFAPKGNAFVRADFVQDEKSRSRVAGSGFSIGAAFKSIGIGFSHSSTSGDYFNSIDEYYRIYRRMELRGKEVIDVVWTPEAEAFLKKNDIKGFYKTCGTRYVRIVRSGQILDTMVRTNLTANSKGTADANSVGINFASIISLGSSGGNAEANLNSYANVSFVHDGKGSLTTPPIPFPPAVSAPAVAASGTASGGAGASTGVTVPNTPLVSLLQYNSPSGYDASVLKAGRSSAVPLWIEVQSYSDQNLDMVEKIPKWPDQIAFIMQKKYPLFQDLLFAKSDLDWALAGAPGASFARLNYYTLKEIPAADEKPPITPEQQAKEKQAKAIQLMADFQADVSSCRTIIDVELTKFGDGQAAVTTCAALLDTHLKQDAVDALKLERNMAPGPTGS